MFCACQSHLVEMLTCKKSGCYKRAKESPFENIVASSQFQQDLDAMSSDEETEPEMEPEEDQRGSLSSDSE